MIKNRNHLGPQKMYFVGWLRPVTERNGAVLK